MRCGTLAGSSPGQPRGDFALCRTYNPIDCDFHDVLEAAATLRRNVAIDHLDDEGNRRVVDARIADLFAREGAEYMRLDDGSLIRLDKLVSIDDAQRSAAFERGHLSQVHRTLTARR